jgi:hypothetical protein
MPLEKHTHRHGGIEHPNQVYVSSFSVGLQRHTAINSAPENRPDLGRLFIV